MSKYDDIIDLPHPEPKHPRMSSENRAAQFAPFSALTTLNAALTETARLTDKKIELSAEEQLKLSHRLKLAYERHLRVSIIHFSPDVLKEGGQYTEVTGIIKKLDETDRLLILEDSRTIPLDAVLSLLYL